LQRLVVLLEEELEAPAFDRAAAVMDLDDADAFNPE
jgi:hypothetical protein